MENLITPLGSVAIYKDDLRVKYSAIKLNNDPRLFPNIDGRYKIIVEYESDNLPHCIYCVIEDIDYREINVSPEAGERLECQSFYQDKVKLSMGIECDTDYFDTGERFGNYDYDSIYLDKGIGYNILSSTKDHEFVFGIAWINKYTDENDIQTWFGADPTIM
ncbi:hypothetical protein [Clostridium intestinale]|uniref:Uncharacterized protein n=1 Tax=Clostridium intestinale TaxID=36845 RepID=A0A7D6VT52_9CLOT|nr:hypothetical protein [Clostridium intestinale]QLY81268.1 hypothetical protein HZF06_06705 [Clostridium intestinale]